MSSGLKGVKKSEEHKKKISEANKGKRKSSSHRKKIKESWTEERRNKQRYFMIKNNPMAIPEYRQKIIGSGNPSWRGGIAGSGYPPYFSESRVGVLKRDNNTCQLCFKKSDSNHVHHINYDKINCNQTNLITLCGSCHAKTLTRRSWWKEKLYIRVGEIYGFI